MGGTCASGKAAFVLSRTLLVDLHAEGAADLGAERLGGKGAGLARLAAGGLTVPPGLVLTTMAYRKALDAVAALDGDRTVQAVERRWLDAPLPNDVQEAVSEAFDRLGDGGLAVRSSASGEDGLAASFAGQQVTALNVVGGGAGLVAVRRCWASLWSPRSLTYRGRHAGHSMGVVLQRMAPPEVSGVMFTRDPVDPRAAGLVVESTFGLGDAVVGGGVADRYRLRRSDGAVTERRLADKAGSRRSRPGGGVEETPLPDDLRTADSLSPELGAALADLSKQVEQVLGRRGVDVEWAWDGAGLHVLQARPITGMTVGSGATRVVWSNINVGEALPGPATTMTWSFIRRFARQGFEKAFGAHGLDVPAEYELFGSIRGRVYLNLTEFMSIASQIPFLTPETWISLGGGCDPALLSDTLPPGGASTLAFMRRLPAALPRLARSQGLAPLIGRWHTKQFRAWRKGVLERDLSALDRPALSDEFDDAVQWFGRTGDVMLAAGANAVSSYAAVRAVLARTANAKGIAPETALFTALDDVRSAAPGEALRDLARSAPDVAELREFRAGDDPVAALQAAGPTFRRAFDRFLAEFGLRAVAEAELATPRWREDPSFPLAVIGAHMRKPASTRLRAAPPPPPALPVLARVALAPLLPVARSASRLREQMRECVTESLGVLRIYLVEFGRRMVLEGRLVSADDVFFLTFGEVTDWLAGQSIARRGVVLERRVMFEAEHALPDPPDTVVIGPSGELADGTGSNSGDTVAGGSTDALVKGLPACPGAYVGPCFIATQSCEAAAMPAGSVLVIPSADVGWTPLFLLAGAVVAEQGGTLSHAAVVAREYGVPTVMGATGAIGRLRTGQVVRVDGATGMITAA